jgi:glucose/arabinose dehydrogenase
MDFVGEDLLVLEKNSGNVRLVRDGVLQEEPVLHVEVVNFGSSGLLGITHVKDDVFLYMTQETDDSDEPLVNRIYKYKWNGEKLVDPILINEILINELPGNPRHGHVAGVMVTDLEGNVYAIIGDLFREGLLQHFENGEPDDSSMVLRVGLDEKIIRPYLSENPYDHYYGIGIRNSFGLTIDPVTEYLWQTENGPEDFDEINLIRPGFDGGWKSIRGPATEEQIQNLNKIEGYTYSNPEFSWETKLKVTHTVIQNLVGKRWYLLQV